MFQKLLLAGVYAFALSLLLDLGTYRAAGFVCAFALAGLLGSRSPEARLDRPVAWMLGIGLVFLIQGWWLADRPIAGKFQWALIWGMVVATAVSLLPDRVSCGLSHRDAVGGLLVLCIAAQAVGYALELKKAGLFSNIHYMALYSVITLPVLYYLALEARAATRWVFALALLGDFLLLMKTHSRPGYLALLAAGLAVVPFLAPRRCLRVVGAILLIPTVLYFSGWFGFAARIDDLVANFAREERLEIWRQTWQLQMNSSWIEWWFGHGLGQFYEDYLVFPRNHWWKDYYASPHNYVLDLLYSHGWTGLALFVYAYGLLFTKLAATVRASRSPALRRLGVMLISSATAQFVIGFLTFPFFSRHNLYPFSLILGVGLRYITDARHHD